jgi:signal transduction histidine kinase
MIIFLIFGILTFNSIKNSNENNSKKSYIAFSAINTESIINSHLESEHIGEIYLRRTIYDITTKNKNLTSIFIYKTDGELIYEYNKKNINIKEILNKSPDKSLMSFDISIMQYKDNYIVLVPYIDEWQRHFYSVAFIYSLKNIIANTRQFVFYFAFFEIVLFLIAIATGYIFSKVSTQKLEILERNAIKIENGDFNSSILLEGSDEFSHISKTMEKMRISIKGYIDQLNITIDKLKENNIIKDEFLENVSHELKTPLTTILGFIDCLSNETVGELNEKQKIAVNKIGKNANKLSELISTLLLIQDKYREKWSEISLIETIKNAEERYNRLAKQKNLDFVVNYSNFDYIILADEDKFNSIINNLLGNAVKFTEKGEITITIDETIGKRLVVIKIRDTGIGIPEAKRKIIFDKFVQIDGSTRRKHGGVGIGLYNTREFVKDLNGDISIESKENVGTTVKVKFPYLRKGI